MVFAAIILVAAAISAAAVVFYMKNRKFSVADLVEESTEWTPIYWAGKRRKFRVRSLNLLTLLASGEYPNTLLLEVMAANKEKKDLDPTKEVELLKERNKLVHEIAQKSMVEPAYSDLLEKMQAVHGPDYDFDAQTYADLMNYQSSKIPEAAKKKRI